MRTNFAMAVNKGPRLQDDDQLHNIPVQQMGNYQEYLKKMPPSLRELETAPVRQHMFGNPFKVNKVSHQLLLIGFPQSLKLLEYEKKSLKISQDSWKPMNFLQIFS